MDERSTAEGTAPDLVAEVRAADAAGDLFEPGSAVVVGLSGGGDSTALLHALCRYGAAHELRLHAAHLDHGLRPEAADDAAAARATAAHLDVPFTGQAVDVAAVAAARGFGLEQAARRVRYAFLARTAVRVGAPVVAVAHHRDDQAETVLMHLLRGAGLDGLAAMTPRARYPLSSPAVRALASVFEGGRSPSDPSTANERRPSDAATAGASAALEALTLVRPLLHVPREDLRAYLRAHALPWREDASNRDRRFLRARVRHDYLPRLEAENPQLRAALARTAAAVADDLALIEPVVRAAWDALARPAADGVIFDRAGWLDAPPAVQRRLLRRAYARLVGDAQGAELGWDHVETARQLAAQDGGAAQLDLPGRVRLRRSYRRLVVERAAADDGRGRGWPPLPIPLDVPGVRELPDGWRLVMTGPDAPPSDVRDPNPWRVVVDARSVSAGLYARPRQPGDRLQPLGMGGRHRSLQDVFVDAKVPRVWRDRWPVVVGAGEDDASDGGPLIWIPGLRLDRRARVRPGTRRAITLTARPPAQMPWSPAEEA